MQVFRELGVSILSKGSETLGGSGCIIQNAKVTYVLTAFHCLSSNKKNRDLSAKIGEFTIKDADNDNLIIKKIHTPLEEEYDFAVIEIETTKKYTRNSITTPLMNMKYKIFGFPNFLEHQRLQGDSLDGYISEVVDDYELILQHQILYSDEKDAYATTKGYSGGGMYVEKNGEFFLIGIVRALRAEGEHGKLSGINISAINSFLESKQLVKLNQYIVEFDQYMEIIELEELDHGKDILKKVYKDNLKGISPAFLHDILKEKIVLPYDKNGSYTDDEIWKGWVKLLLYISLYKKEKISVENLEKHIYLNNKSKGKNSMYYTNNREISEVVKHIYDYAYDDLCNNGIVILNAKYLNYTKALDNKKLKRIVKTIDETMTTMYNRGIDITNSKKSKNFAVIPLTYIINEVNDYIFEMRIEGHSIFEIEEKSINKIDEMFAEFKDMTEMEE